MLRSKLYNHFKDDMPRESDLLIALDNISRFIKTDDKFTLSWKKSKRGVVCLSCQASTIGVPWHIDMYKGNFIFARILNHYDTFDNPRKAIDFIRASLRRHNVDYNQDSEETVLN